MDAVVLTGDKRCPPRQPIQSHVAHARGTGNKYRGKNRHLRADIHLGNGYWPGERIVFLIYTSDIPRISESGVLQLCAANRTPLIFIGKKGIVYVIRLCAVC